MPSDTFPTRRIGELEVSALGLGCMGMSFAYGATDRAESLATINRALDAGVRFLDTAEMYGNGHNEELLREVLATRRDDAVVATKFGIRTDPETSMPAGNDGSPENARRAVDGSLSRLGIDTIDLYYLHRVDPDVPIEETVGAMGELVAAGKVRALGLSEASAETLRRASAVHPIAALQSEWSVFSRDIERDVLPTARGLGIALVPYSPLGRGLLTGAAAAYANLADDDFRRTLPRWQAENLDANLALVRRIREIATDLGATASQVALAWLLAGQRRRADPGHQAAYVPRGEHRRRAGRPTGRRRRGAVRDGAGR
ncbi:aldo/keto reductase [Solicola gregarius]|uniref:Aldo/keto reductase n=1 Tax=Solicola gregarius TaxID=2908642 RepID=A0AA46TM71_9ACTN|nr:aldo/keto reductase [Solicola gregarius]UYM07489.1 aldo/keto reductase [Solicola gregarius]